MHYTPKIDDYVKWKRVEGWIYFMDHEYITIEIAVKDKPDNFVIMHKKVHCLVVCYKQDWNQLEYKHSRRYQNASNLDDMEIYVREFQ